MTSNGLTMNIYFIENYFLNNLEAENSDEQPINARQGSMLQ